MSFSCCSRYESCWNDGICVNPYPDLVADYNYKKKLDQSMGFHLKNQERITLAPEVNRDTLYLMINDRLLRISKRSSYGWWSYPLEKDEMESCIKKLNECDILWSDILLDNHCADENTSGMERALYRISMTIGDIRYTITNYNGMLIKESTASEIRKILLDHGMQAALEVTGSKSTNQHIKYQYKSNKINVKSNPESSFEVNKVESTNGQVSMFDLFPGL